MNITEQVQNEAKEMIEGYYNLNNDEVYEWATDIPYPVAKMCAIIEINKILSLRVQPVSYYEKVKDAIINYIVKR